MSSPSFVGFVSADRPIRSICRSQARVPLIHKDLLSPVYADTSTCLGEAITAGVVVPELIRPSAPIVHAPVQQPDCLLRRDFP